ncbi:hypothetical protein CCP3SC15_400012 [Gammaproteobacteria bacterium]
MADNDYFSVSVGDSVEKIRKKIAALPAQLADAGTEAASNLLLDALVNKEIPEYHGGITRMSVYGQTFKTPKMRRWFFWALKSGLINVPYIRRGKSSGIQSSWRLIGRGAKTTITNQAQGAIYLYDNNRQSRFMGLMGVGWNKIGVILAQYTPQMVRSFANAVRQVIKKQGFS